MPDSQAQVDVGMPSHSVDFNPDGNHLAIGGVNGSVKVLSVADMNQLVAQVSDCRNIHLLQRQQGRAWSRLQPFS